MLDGAACDVAKMQVAFVFNEAIKPKLIWRLVLNPSGCLLLQTKKIQIYVYRVKIIFHIYFSLVVLAGKYQHGNTFEVCCEGFDTSPSGAVDAWEY